MRPSVDGVRLVGLPIGVLCLCEEVCKELALATQVGDLALDLAQQGERFGAVRAHLAQALVEVCDLYPCSFGGQHEGLYRDRFIRQPNESCDGHL